MTESGSSLAHREGRRRVGASGAMPKGSAQSSSKRQRGVNNFFGKTKSEPGDKDKAEAGVGPEQTTAAGAGPEQTTAAGAGPEQFV